MLTKQERTAIVNRLRECNTGGFYDIYTAVTGEKVPSRTTRDEDFTAISNVILDLCDTSNMVELPRDKDGEVIHIDDTVYDDDGNKHRVGGYSKTKDNWEIIISFGSNGYFINGQPNKLTHKNPVTIASLVEQIRDVINGEEYVYPKSYMKLARIADKLESLGDSDD